MKISLIGYGKMGRMIEEEALNQGHDIVSKVDPYDTQATHKIINADSLGDADVCIEFTTPETVIDNISIISSLGKNIVIGTTGWYDRIDEISDLITDIGVVYSPNFSLGVGLFKEILSHAATLISQYSCYDVAGFEHHHNKKADSPSGTAKAIAELLLEKIENKSKIVYDRVDSSISPEELHFSSLRCGNAPGTHSVIFDSEADTIKITHQAHNRKGFALGSIKAAEWIIGKKGLFKFMEEKDV